MLDKIVGARHGRADEARTGTIRPGLNLCGSVARWRWGDEARKREEVMAMAPLLVGERFWESRGRKGEREEEETREPESATR